MEKDTISIKDGGVCRIAGIDEAGALREDPLVLLADNVVNKIIKAGDEIGGVAIDILIENSMPSLSKQDLREVIDRLMITVKSNVIILNAITIRKNIFENDEQFTSFWNALLPKILETKE